MMGKHFNMKSVDREIFSEIFFSLYFPTSKHEPNLTKSINMNLYLN